MENIEKSETASDFINRLMVEEETEQLADICSDIGKVVARRGLTRTGSSTGT